MKFVLLILLSFVIVGCNQEDSFDWDKNANSNQPLLGTNDPLVGTPASFSGLWSGDCKLTSNPQTDCKSIIQISQTVNTIDIQITQVVDFQYQQMPTRTYAISGNSIIELTPNGSVISNQAVGTIGAGGFKIQSQGLTLNMTFKENTKTAVTDISYTYTGIVYSVNATVKR